jgi:DNA-binding XRE family transcriptional regulator
MNEIISPENISFSIVKTPLTITPTDGMLSYMTPSELISWRKERGYSQKTLADKLGVAEVTVFRWEKEMRAIPPLLPLALSGLEYEEVKRGKGKGKEKER